VSGGGGRRGRIRRTAAVSAGIALAGIVMIAAAGAGAWVALNWSSGSSEVTVPDLSGLTEGDAARRAETVGLKLEVTEERNDRLVPRARILGQDPLAGSRTRPGRTVRVVRSLGDLEIVIPELVGRPAREARLAIQQLGLRVGTISSVHWSDPGDRILAQRPRAGEMRSKGDPVSLLISHGLRPRIWLMPDLSGRSGEAARSLLESANLRIAPGRPEQRTGVPTGSVLRQTPSVGSPVTERQVVTLTLAE